MNLSFKRFCKNTDCNKVEMVRNAEQASKPFCRSCQISMAKKGKPSWNSGKTNIYTDKVRESMGAKNKGNKLSSKHKKNIASGLIKAYETNGSKLKGRKLKELHKHRISNSLNEMKASRIKVTPEQFLDFCKSENIQIQPFDNVLGQQDRVNIQCACGEIYSTKVQQLYFGYGRQCQSCNNTRSLPEIEIFKFLTGELGISEQDILKNVKPRFMNSFGLDLYLPNHKIAIEYHGLAHHSERPVFEMKDLKHVRIQHQLKYKLCKNEGIKLIQIFEDEWLYKSDIIKSMLKSRLNKSLRTEFARKTTVILINKEEAREFIKANHIAGSVRNEVAFGLKTNTGELLSILTLRQPWQKNYGNVLEIARFCSLKDTSIVGGFSKLLKQACEFSKQKGYEGILTYADCRFGSGDVYLKNNFEYLGNTEPNFFYEKNQIREHRFKHRKDKTKSGTGRQQQNALGWYAIYDAGNEIYKITF